MMKIILAIFACLAVSVSAKPMGLYGGYGVGYGMYPGYGMMAGMYGYPYMGMYSGLGYMGAYGAYGAYGGFGMMGYGMMGKGYGYGMY